MVLLLRFSDEKLVVLWFCCFVVMKNRLFYVFCFFSDEK